MGFNQTVGWVGGHDRSVFTPPTPTTLRHCWYCVYLHSAVHNLALSHTEAECVQVMPAQGFLSIKMLNVKNGIYPENIRLFFFPAYVKYCGADI